MKNLSNILFEKLKINKNTDFKERTPLDDEMELWDKRMAEPFGQALKELQCIIMDSSIYPTTKNEYGLNVYTPFDNYITAYALDGDKEYTYSHIKDICDNYDWTENHRYIKKQLAKIKSLI